VGKRSFEYLIIGIFTLLLGVSFNFLVVAFNGMRMPTSLQYVEDCFSLVDAEGNQVAVSPDMVVTLPDGRVFMDGTTNLKALSDIIHIENFAFNGYYSVGDILIELGTISTLLLGAFRFLAWARKVYTSRHHFHNTRAYI
jgi:hypothetical protein